MMNLKPGLKVPSNESFNYIINEVFDRYLYQNTNQLNESIEYDDYLHGSCHQWVLDNYQSGDKIFVITDYDYDIEDYALVHCGIYRDNQYIDVRGCMDDIDEVLEEFDYGEEMDVQIMSFSKFISYCKLNGLTESKKTLKKKDLKNIINECVDRCLRKHLNENTKYSIPKFLYHATPSCYLSSIKKNGLGGKIPRKRFWDYDNTEYANIRKGCFLATDEYVAESYLEASEEFEYFSEWYEERYGKELNIVVFKIPTSNLDIRLLKIDTNQLIDDETEPTYFYDGIIPYNQMSIIQLY